MDARAGVHGAVDMARADLRHAARRAAFALAALLALGCGDDADPDAGRRADAAGSDAGRDAGDGVDAAGVEDGGAADGGDAGEAPTCDGSPPTGDARLDGALVTWHPLELTFAGPTMSEDGLDPNPFLDRRLQVTLDGPAGQRFVVPGFFDGDGAGGGAGDAWRVRFHADAPGEWTWRATFREGPEVAIDPAEDAGVAGALDGASGRFCVEPPDPAAPGFLAHGRLEHAGHHLRLSDGAYWIKGGTDSPENLLGYAGFDGTVDQPGGTDTTGLVDGLHRYAPHVDDWAPGDPDWGDGAGRGIVGALNYLASEGVNSIYFLPCNLLGDGRDTYPYVSPDDLRHLDVSKLAQWEIVFRHAQRSGIALHFVLNETEDGNERLHDDGTLGVTRRLYYRELAARFAHHLALFWNIGEENDYGATRQRQFAEYLRSVDPYDHPTTVHTHHDRPEDQYRELVGVDGFELASLQTSPGRAAEHVEQWRRQSAAAGRPWAVMVDEVSPAGEGLTDTNADDRRRRVLWPALLSGAAGIEWYFGYHPLPLGGDVRAEDFRTRQPMWRYTRIARTFLEELPFWRMEPADGLLSGASAGGDVLAAAGEVYAVHLERAGGAPRLDLSAATGAFTVQWLDPRTGERAGVPVVREAGPDFALGAAPRDADDDWVVLVTGGGAPAPPPTVARLVLVDADTDGDLGPLEEGATVDLGTTPRISVRAETVPAVVGSVRFALDGDPAFRTESEAPYSLAGDTDGDFAPWAATPGSHTLGATAFPEAGARGEAGAPLEVTFTVVE